MTTVDRPEVTVLMPVRDAARFVGAAVDSLLAQTVHALEVIVVDDGSVDGSLDIVRARADRRISILEPGGGVGVARALNIGLGAARAPVVARQDADDVAHPRRLERQLAVLRERRDLAIVGARGYTADASGRRVGAVDRPLHAVSPRLAAVRADKVRRTRRTSTSPSKVGSTATVCHLTGPPPATSRPRVR